MLKLFLITGYFLNPGEPVSSDFILLPDILTIFVGIFGIASLTVIGIRYLTSPGHSPRVRQSKRYLFEIIIGLTIYATVYALLRWALLIFDV